MICETMLKDGKPQFGFPGRHLPFCWVPYPQPSLVDLNGDGEPDIVLGSSYNVVYWMEHSFLTAGSSRSAGYAEGEFVRAEARAR
jgi:hypothetical protein